MRPIISCMKAAIFSCALLTFAGAQGGPNDTVWTRLWTGNNLSDWDFKFTGSAVNVNFNNTFRAVSGILEINYSNWTTNWGGQFGHAGYRPDSTFSFYFIRAEYQHWGTQPSGSPTWAYQNNGLMLHSQTIRSMGISQDFPVSMETQLLGSGNVDADNNSTLNLCTPGTAFYDTPTGPRNNNHCVSATTNTRPASGVWAWASAWVLGDSIIRHYNGPVATGTPTFTYYRPIQAPNSGASGVTIPLVDNRRITQGSVLIQAESHPYRFRVLDVMNLVGCMTVGNANYKTYFVRNNPAACATPIVRSREGLLSRSLSFDPVGRKLHINVGESFSAKLSDLQGKAVWERRGTGGNVYDLSSIQPRGLYFLTLARGKTVDTQKLMLE